MHSSDEEYYRRNYRESIRRNRQERINQIKEFFRAPQSDASGKEMLLGTAFFIAFTAGIVAIALKCGKDKPENKNASLEISSVFRPTYPVAAPFSNQSAAPRHQIFSPAIKGSDAEMDRKYKGIVKKKQRLLRETNEILKKYTKQCLKEPLSKSRLRYCDQLDRKNTRYHEWIRRH